MNFTASLFAIKPRILLSSRYFWIGMRLLFSLLLCLHPVYAADATGGGGAGLPWEAPLVKLRQSISGPVAFAIALLGIIGCGATLIWGGEVTEFARRIVYLVLVICIIVFANTLLTGAMFSGAVLPTDTFIKITDLVSEKIIHPNRFLWS